MNLTLLIDLDDTLLPHSSERFLPAYLNALSNHLSSVASPDLIQQNLLHATYEAISNLDPETTIKQTFDQNFYPQLGTTPEHLQDSILDFYNNEYLSLSPISSPDPDVIDFMKNSIEKGYQLAIATNPIFPRIATYQRLRWAGLPPEDFPYSLITTYEDFHFAKPHPAYYMEILAQMGWPENQVVVIGNDFENDILPGKDLGLATYWVTNDYTKMSCALKHGAGKLKDFHAWLDIQTEDSITPDLGGFNTSLETFRSTPAALLTFLNHIPSDQWKRKPNPESWSITEILCHLRDVDMEVHIPRFRMLRDIPSPFLTAVDADTWAEERNYQQQDGQQALSDFIEARKKLVDLITDLPETVVQKDIRHTIFGPITLDEIMRIAARHDRLHIQQIHTTIF
jgi:FMN phosphatase YigB (HAD superfamily)